MLRKGLFFICIYILTSCMSAWADVYKFDVTGAIGPATSDYVKRAIANANSAQADVIILQLDTPGGLDKSMREIIRSILNSNIPVVTFVAPSGARAASAGAFILYASHVAAMAPGTNLGAASPVQIGKDIKPLSSKNKVADSETILHQKVTNDAVAYIRSLAQMRGRNIKLAEQMVINATTLTAKEAKAKKVIEYIATDITALLKRIQDKEITLKGNKVKINIPNNYKVVQLQPDWRSRLLDTITDPSIAYILLLLGIYGIFFEFANPGFMVPGVIGAISALLALYAFQLLPISYVGLALVILGVAFMIAEAFVPSFGILGIGGVGAFIIGSIFLIDASVIGYQLPITIIAIMAIINFVVLSILLGMLFKARKLKVISGKEKLLHKTGFVVSDLEEFGQGHFDGEIWRIHSKQPLKISDPIQVIGQRGLILEVKKLSRVPE